MPRKYSDEFKAKAVRLAEDLVELEGCSKWGAAVEIGEKLGIPAHTLNDWLKPNMVSSDVEIGAGESAADELKRLRKEIKELRRANEILKTASGFFRGGTRPSHQKMIEYIDAYRDRFGVEAICRTLKETECGFITSRGYRAAKTRAPSARSLSDALLIPELVRVYEDNFSVYGVRKMWKAMQRAGWSIGRDQTARLMKQAGIYGRRRGRTPMTTLRANVPDCRPDLVNRDFTAPAPHRLWVADITYVRTLSGFAYTAFITDVYSRKIVGVATRASMRTDELPLEAFEHALYHAGDLRSEGLVHHSDRGSQYVSIRYGEALAQAGIDPSVGTVGDSYDNALAETVNGLYKTELIYPHRPWASVGEVEIATLRWVHWWNNQRLHQSLGYITPQEMEDAYYQRSGAQTLGVK
ncbi:IS3 family transposase [Corynebacterium appendicis]|uniref:IS3 family transposase n=1 Tax=Corynebacterium appendicis TaxID=163202 RepID=UPI0025B46D29|nr:IS3 family transposase [Corynebacterium appendicis]